MGGRDWIFPGSAAMSPPQRVFTNHLTQNSSSPQLPLLHSTLQVPTAYSPPCSVSQEADGGDCPLALCLPVGLGQWKSLEGGRRIRSLLSGLVQGDGPSLIASS